MENWTRYAHPGAVFADLALACVGAGEFTGYAEGFRGRRLRTHGAVVVSEGTGWYSSPGTGDLAIRAPALIWLFPGVQHGYGPTREGWTEHWVLFAGSAARMLDELSGWDRAAPVVHLDEVPGSLPGVFAELRPALAGNGIVGALRASATCYGWLTELASENLADTEPDLIDAFIRGCASQLSMAARARELGVDLPRLRAAALAATGLTPLQLLIESRLARAQSLLAETDLPVSAISARVGFEDPAYFSRQFARRRGVSPVGFRREQQRAAQDEAPLDS